MTLTEFIKELEEIVHEWYLLGCFLEVDQPELDTIEYNNPKDVAMCKAKLFGAWSNMKNPLWSDLVYALFMMGKDELARRIMKKYGKFIHLCEDHQN